MNPAREKVVAEALTWRSTPYHHQGRVKGAGVDCAMLLFETFKRAGVVAHFDIDYYPHDWHFHRSTERYIAYLLTVMAEVKTPPERTPLPGDAVVFKFGRCFSHGAIVVDWPIIIHAYIGRPVACEDVSIAKHLRICAEGSNAGKPREMRVFVLKEWLLPEENIA